MVKISEYVFYSCDVVDMFSVYVVLCTCFLFMWYRGHVFCLCGRGHVLCLYGVMDMFYVYVVSWTYFLFMWCRRHVFCTCSVLINLLVL